MLLKTKETAIKLFDDSFEKYKKLTNKQVAAAPEYVMVESEELLRSITEQNAALNLSPSGFEYEMGDSDIERLGNVNKRIRELIKDPKAEPAIVERVKLEGEALDIGSYVDGVARAFFSNWNKMRQMQRNNSNAIIENPGRPNYEISSIYDNDSLFNVLEAYALAIENYAHKRGFTTVEFLSEGIRVYDDSSPDTINNNIIHMGSDGQPMYMSGVATETDLVVRLKREQNGKVFIQDIILDFKTTALDNFYNKSNPNIERTLSSWRIQNAATASMYSNNHGSPVYDTGILPMHKVKIKGKVGFNLPFSVRESIKSLAEDGGMNAKDNALPFWRTGLTTQEGNVLYQFIKKPLAKTGTSLELTGEVDNNIAEKNC